MQPANQLTLMNGDGRRKYLCASELPRFLGAANKADVAIKLFCHLLAFTGCRISEALSVTPLHLDAETGRVTFRTLKRRSVVFRTVPVPPEFMTALRRQARRLPPDSRLWQWSRQTAWRHVKTVMDAAKIAGPQAMPKGLRHGFGVANAEENVPMPTTQKWLGHAKLETTAVYQDAAGREEVAFARRLWRKWRG
jgi:integrase/recombinase XerD